MGCNDLHGSLYVGPRLSFNLDTTTAVFGYINPHSRLGTEVLNGRATSANNTPNAMRWYVDQEAR